MAVICIYKFFYLNSKLHYYVICQSPILLNEVIVFKTSKKKLGIRLHFSIEAWCVEFLINFLNTRSSLYFSVKFLTIKKKTILGQNSLFLNCLQLEAKIFNF